MEMACRNGEVRLAGKRDCLVFFAGCSRGMGFPNVVVRPASVGFRCALPVMGQKERLWIMSADCIRQDT